MCCSRSTPRGPSGTRRASSPARTPRSSIRHGGCSSTSAGPAAPTSTSGTTRGPAGRNTVELYVREYVQGLDPLPPGAAAELTTEHLYTVLPRRLLLRHIADPVRCLLY